MQYYYNSTDLEKVITHIRVGHVSSGKKHGSGFFIDSNLILTAAHVLKDQNGQINRNYNEYQINSTAIEQINVEDIFDTPNCDIAIIKITQKIPGELVLANYCIDLEKGDQFDSFGYRDINKDDYVPLTGSFQLKFGSHNSKKWYFTSDTNRDTNSGFSGAPILVENKLIGYWIQEINSNGLTQDLYAKLFQDEKIIEFLNDKNLSYIINKQFISKNERNYLNTLTHYRLGLSDDDGELEYQETYATWEDLDKKEAYKENTYNHRAKITDLIEEYFTIPLDGKEVSKFHQILFIIADYGMGKSSFVQNFSKTIADNLLNSKDVMFPIYFNLKDYSRYSDQPVLEDCFLTEYNIELDDVYRNYDKIYFIIDSLDESGILNRDNLKNILSNIRKSLKKAKAINSNLGFKVIVTSRPIPAHLDDLIKENNPKLIQKENRKVYQKISLYGFNENEYQFDRYLKQAIESYEKKNPTTVINDSDLIEKIKSNVGIYDNLSRHFENGELRRPIYAYLIYRLIIKNIEVRDLKKSELYFLFITQLSSQGTYVGDDKRNYEPSKEYMNRYMLHVIAVIWQKNKFQLDSSIIKTKEESKIKCDWENEELLERLNDIKYRSFTYQEKNGSLAFHHQSIAEFLIAEYYLKVFLYYYFSDEDIDIKEFRNCLQIGEPTNQTIEFLEEIINQIITSIEGNPYDESDKKEKNMIAARVALFPLLVSLGIKIKKDNSTGFENIKKFHSEWIFENLVMQEGDIFDKTKIYSIVRSQWPITKKILKKIVLLSREIIQLSDSVLLMKKSELKNDILISKENVLNTSIDMDKWLSLFIGKCFCEKLNLESFYDQKTSLAVATMFKNWSILDGRCCPVWGTRLFSGIQLIGDYENPIRFNNINFGINHIENRKGTDFSNSKLSFVDFGNCNLSHVSFKNCNFDTISFYRATIFGTIFSNIKIEMEAESESLRKSMGILLFDANFVDSVKLPNKIASQFFFIRQDENRFKEYIRLYPEIESIFFDSTYKYSEIRLTNSNQVLDNGETIAQLFTYLIKYRNANKNQLLNAYYYFEEQKGVKYKKDPFRMTLENMIKESNKLNMYTDEEDLII